MSQALPGYRGGRERRIAIVSREVPHFGSETIRSTASVTYATDPNRVFLVTGDNKTSGPPLTSDADYVSLCLS